MKNNFLNPKYWLIYLVIAIWGTIILPGCNDEENFPYAGNATVQGELKYIDIVTGNSKDVPVGAEIEVFYRDNTLPDFTLKTIEKGKYKFTPQATGVYKMKFNFNDSTLQYMSSLVKSEDLDTLKTNEFHLIEYSDSTEISIRENEIVTKSVVLKTNTTGLRIIAKDSLGNRLSNIQICLYNNERFYEENFPNCGGSLKYLNTNGNGIAFFSGLESIRYLINARGKVGKVNLNNYYSAEAQVVQNLESGSIEEMDLILK